MIIRDLAAAHVMAFAVRNPQIDGVTYELAKALEANGNAWSGWHGGECVGCGGWSIDPADAGRGVAWGLIGPATRPLMLAITRAVRPRLDRCGLRRLETHVLVDFEAGHRWARMLGFAVEAKCMRSYDPSGRDVSLYARIFD